MKKLTSIILSVAFVLSLAACGGSSAAPAPQATIEISADDTNEDIAVSALRAFLSEGIYQKLVGDYESAIGEKAREFEITDASEYTIPDLEGVSMHIMMINAAADVMIEKDSAIYDRLILLVDLDSGAVYDQYSVDAANFDGDLSTAKGKVKYAINCYNSYLMGSNDGIMTNPNTEVKTDLTAEEISAINAAIR